MHILDHRGRWYQPSERNSLAAFVRSFVEGNGCELDVRDAAGTLVVSHDPPLGPTLLLDTVLREFRAAGQPGLLAMNVKCDGLADAIADACQRLGVQSFFCFDQSLPDLVSYVARGVPSFTRQSDIEPYPLLYDAACGVWLDSFHDDAWFDEGVVADHVQSGKRVCIVSPELHGRDPITSWTTWAKWPVTESDDVLVCTDRATALAEVVA